MSEAANELGPSTGANDSENRAVRRLFTHQLTGIHQVNRPDDSAAARESMEIENHPDAVIASEDLPMYKEFPFRLSETSDALSLRTRIRLLDNYIRWVMNRYPDAFQVPPKNNNVGSSGISNGHMNQIIAQRHVSTPDDFQDALAAES